MLIVVGSSLAAVNLSTSLSAFAALTMKDKLIKARIGIVKPAIK